jgi:hypothetical protein
MLGGKYNSWANKFKRLPNRSKLLVFLIGSFFGYMFLGLLFSGRSSKRAPLYRNGYYEAPEDDKSPFASPNSNGNADDYSFDNSETNDYDFSGSLFEPQSDDDKLEEYLKKLKAEEQVRTGASSKAATKAKEEKPILVHKEGGIPVPWHQSEENSDDTSLENAFQETQNENSGKCAFSVASQYTLIKII